MSRRQPTRMLPADTVATRLCTNLAQIDQLFDLLVRVNDGYRFTNRMDEAVLLVPEDVMAEIRHVVRFIPSSPEREF